MRTLTRDIVGGLLISKDKKYFVALKKTGGVYHHHWHIPGGGIEKGETKEKAIKREILEETGIDIFNLPMRLVDDTGRGESEKVLRETGEKVFMKMHFFVYEIQLNANAADISVTINDEFSNFGWFSLQELVTIPLAPPTVALLKKLGYLP